MSLYQKFLIIVALIAIIGIPIFVIDFNNLSWNNNRESYWGLIAMIALIGAILLNNKSDALKKNIKDLEEEQSKKNSDI